MKIKECFALLLLLTPICGFSQIESSDKTLNEKSFIEVVGTALKEVMPDKIFISISLNDKVDNKEYDVKAQEIKLKAALTKVGIDLDNLVLTDAGADVIRERRRHSLFEVSKDYILQVKTAAQVSDVIKELYANNIKDCSVSRVESSAIESLRKEVRIAAIKAAKDKATYLLEAIGEAPDKPLEIREQSESCYGYNYKTNVSIAPNTRLEESTTESQDLNFRMMTVKFSYYIKYSIK
jgi:uncharacterized protein YggE